MNKLSEINFEYCIEKNYNYMTYCESYGCDDEGICRCGTIEDAEIRSVDVSKLSLEIYSNFFDNSKATKRNIKINSILSDITTDVDRYTIDRILRSSKIWEECNWDLRVTGGYYGQEFDGVYLNCLSLQIQIEEALEIDSLDKRVEFLLNLEYGQILPELVGKSWKVIEVKKSQISIGSSSHLSLVKDKNLDFYSKKNYSGIRGVVLQTGRKLRLIDGYHRLSKMGDEDLVSVLCAF